MPLRLFGFRLNIQLKQLQGFALIDLHEMIDQWRALQIVTSHYNCTTNELVVIGHASRESLSSGIESGSKNP